MYVHGAYLDRRDAKSHPISAATDRTLLRWNSPMYPQHRRKGGSTLAARIGTGFRLGLAAALLLLLLAVAGGGYYYAVYAPPVAAPDNARALEQARAEALKRVAQQRLLAQQQEQEQRAAAQRQAAKAAAQAAYQACLTSAAATRNASQAAECKRLADKTAADRADCLGKLKLPQAYCGASYPARDAAPDCTLPAEIATVLDAAVERARYRCERESKAAE
jgi:hypothetical protein